MNPKWQIRTLAEIADNLDSKRRPITKSVRSKGEYPYYGASGIVDYVADYIFDGDCLLISEDGANLLSRSTPIAFSASGKYWVNNHAHILQFSSLITQRFVELYIASISIAEYVSGMAQPKLNQKALNSIPIPYPPLAEQKRIVALLDQVLEAIETAKGNAERSLGNASALGSALRDSIFERNRKKWKLSPLGDIAEVQSGGTPKVSEKSFWGGSIPWYSSGELNAFVTNCPERTISEKGLASSNAKLFPKGSLLIGMYDTAALKMSILDRDAAFNQAVAGVKPTPNVNLAFVMDAINSMKTELLALRRGTRQKNLSLEKIKRIPILTPPRQTQDAIHQSIRNVWMFVDTLASTYTRKITLLDELQKSILVFAFSGAM